jgi:predicted HicB family RNase H-like nuclease
MKKKEKKIAMKLMIEPSLLKIVRQESKKRGISMNAFVRKSVFTAIQQSSSNT